MALFDQHIVQARSNLDFLQQINQKIGNYYDWQVTVCFYTALHFVNAHLTHHSLQYRQHKDVNFALNPEVVGSISKLPVPEYDAYMGLQRLSRRSRYLVNEKDRNVSNIKGFLTYEKHLATALRNLDKLIAYFSAKYKLSIDSVHVTCQEISTTEKLKYFSLARQA